MSKAQRLHKEAGEQRTQPRPRSRLTTLESAQSAEEAGSQPLQELAALLGTAYLRYRLRRGGIK